jgi:hypothetical protein
LATAAALTVIDDFLDTEIASIISTLGAAGAGLTAIPWNAAWDTEVQSEVDDALVARNLDKLVIVSGTADSGSTTTMVDAARTEGDADYWKGRLLVFTSGNISGQCAIITDFNAGTDTFTFAPALTQAVATQNYIILPGISVWDDTLAEHLVAGTTGNALNAAGAAGDPWSTALPGAYGAGTAGKIVGDNINATISSRASQASVDTIDDFLDTEIAAILADTNELQTDWADGGRLDLILDARASQASVNTLDDFVDTEVAAILAAVDTEVAAIKAKTDLIPAAPAATGDIPTANQNADALLDRSAGIETGLTPRQAFRLIAAAVAGKLSGAATVTVTIKNAVADDKNRIVATVDADGNRSAITYDLT